MNKRINCIDGWRAIAALGVLYGHVLGTLKTPSFFIFNIDVIRMLNLWGYGVHLFFVISGFCFFLVMNHQKDYSFSYALKFWKKRWLRIAPAFYISCCVYAFLKYKAIAHWFILAIVSNFLFVQPYIPHAEINAIYWSLSSEWIFYLLLPLVFGIINKTGYIPVIISILLLGIILNLLHYKGIIWDGDSWQYTFFANFEHFGWGILIGYLFQENKFRYKAIDGKIGILIGLIIAYTGKMFFTASFVNSMGKYGFIFQGIGPLVMTLGFSWMILNSLRNSFTFKIVGNKIAVSLGRVTYSFYVWHTLFLGIIYSVFRIYFPSTGAGVFKLFFCTLLVLIPFSFFSFRFLESFYFKRKIK